MELPGPVSKAVQPYPVQLRDEALKVMRPEKTIADPIQPHCADHNSFQSDCVVCKRAWANFQPYPIQKAKPVSRSFGFTDTITEEKLRALDSKLSDVSAGDPGYNLSFVILRALLRLIWPF